MRGNIYSLLLDTSAFFAYVMLGCCHGVAMAVLVVDSHFVVCAMMASKAEWGDKN